MTAGITSLSIRSSPTCRRAFQRAVQLTQLAHVHSSGRSSYSAIDPMLARANKTYGDNPPPPRTTLSKQLFPSSSPSASSSDIRDQIMKRGSPGTAAASASARTGDSSSNYIDSRSANGANWTSNRGKSSLASLYGNSNSFQHESTSFVDLTGPDNIAKAKEAVYFAEDDFSDDDDLDLDYEAPSALPTLPSASLPNPFERENMPPPPTSTQLERNIPWSSSPASHFFPPQPQRTISGASNTSEVSLKRDSSGENDSLLAPAPKKAKKRVLPHSFRKEEVEEIHDDPIMKTPNHKAKGLWDTTASAIKEQKRQFKSQHSARTGEPPRAQPKEETQDVEVAIGPKSDAISLSKEQEYVLDLVVNQNQSAFFTGPAGTGKSVLMRAIIQELKRKYARDPERVAVTASTGLAACNIGGITLHSFSGIGLGKEDAPTLVKKIRRNPKAKNRWLKTKCLVIDEISMVDGDLFDKLSQIGRTIRNNGRPWGGIQLIITGDFFQLPPVPDADKKREVKFAFDAATWSTSIDHTIGLTQVFRQRDPKFAQMLNEMRLGRISVETVAAFKALARPLTFDDGVDLAELYPTRAQVDGSNERRLRELPGKIQRYDAMDNGDPVIRDKLLTNMMAPKSLELKLNAQVMLIKNLDESLVNGSLGKVIAFADERTFDMTSVNGFDNEAEDSMAKARKKLKGFSRDPDSASDGRKYPVVQFVTTDGIPRVILCQPEEWKVELPNGEVQAKRTQLPLILAWALSIHKAQGQTLERVTVNLGKVFEKGQAYVALSRATSQEGLRVLGFDKSKVMAHPRVVEFYGKLYSAEEAAARRPNAILDFVANRKGDVAKPALPAVKAAPPAVRKVANVIDLDDDEEAMASYGY